MANKPCPFCEFEKLTQWFFWDRWKNIIICRDKLNKHRLLAVRVGQKNHKKIPTFEERDELLMPLIAIADAHKRNEQILGYTIDEIVNSDHYHYYANIT